MATKKADRRDIGQLSKLIEEIVRLQLRYGRREFPIEDIAQTFADIYLTHLARTPEEDLAVQFVPSSYRQVSLAKAEIIEKIGFEMANAILGAVVKRMKERRAQED